VLYTDGLVEDRAHPIDRRLADLLDAVATGFAAVGASGLPGWLMSGFRSRDDDDVAVLLASREPGLAAPATGQQAVGKAAR